MNREEFVRSLHSKLDHWNHEIDTLVAKKDSLDASARAEFSSRLEELRAQRDHALVQLSAFQDAGENAWQDMKSGLELAWDALSQAITSAKSRFKS